jgi:hypothetical protein
VKHIFFLCLAIIIVPVICGADIIYFTDGMKTVCTEKAWEENGEIKCEYEGVILSYQKKDVLRIEKRRNEKIVEDKPTPQPTLPKKGAQKPAPQKKTSKAANTRNKSLASKEIEFYNPRRPQKYWINPTSKYNTFKEAMSALARQYDRSPEWIQKYMGDSNDLAEIHKNLARMKLNAPIEAQTDKIEKIPETLFYNPRRPQKYWTNPTSKHNTFKEAISALARQYDRSPEWIKKHMGKTNDLNEIHQNLANSKLTESTQ